MGIDSHDIIKLNVGGIKFQTLRSTLRSIDGTYFIGLLDCETPPSGEYFIDRDGTKFGAILNYLRGNYDEVIDPIEGAYFCLPQFCTQFHHMVRKG
jgi:hypothetical protein